ncbi:MAG: hypothetical protein AB6733_00140 [Clostridiaceae bacterium]
MINKDALQYLVELGVEIDPIVKTDLGIYTKMGLTRLKVPKAAVLEVTTLTGLVDYVKSNFDETSERLLVHVDSPSEVKLYSPLNQDRERECYITAKAILPNNIVYNRFVDTEPFNIMLQSSFVDNESKEVLLKYTGLIRNEAVKDTGDDGVSQQVTIKTGVASVGQAIVPNPVYLAPYRTFPEVEQPESRFIFRMKEGPAAAIYEADGGAWRNQAMDNIKNYLMDEFLDQENVQIIS